MIWFCMQIWDKVRIINQTRAVFSSTKEEKENRYYFCFYKKKIESYFCQSLYCNSLLKNQIKSFLLSLHWQILFNTRNIQFACNATNVTSFIFYQCLFEYIFRFRATGQLLLGMFYQYLLVHQYFNHIWILKGSNFTLSSL